MGRTGTYVVLFTTQVNVAAALGQDVQGQGREGGEADKNLPHVMSGSAVVEVTDGHRLVPIGHPGARPGSCVSAS